MSFFYLTPIKGDLPIHLLEIIVTKRLEFLKNIHKKNNISYNEYVVEGSLYDTVGHYMLCIIVILYNNSEFTNFFTKSEVSLFIHRLKTFSAYELRCFSKKLFRIIKKLPINSNMFEPLINLCQRLILKHVAQHVCSDACSETCSLHLIRVPFKHCLSFIAAREVELQHGVALIPCSKWKMFLTILFKDNLRHRISRTNLENLRNDPRITDLMGLVTKEIHTYKSPSNSNILMSNEVDDLSKLFPPCMKNLHQNLRNNHRLQHNQRFSYSLFLKDIGMPVDESVKFWQTEYEQVPCGNHKCCHDWQRDEKKFIYGIRHLYGLEGGRKSYTSGNCLHIQSFTEGACPFKSFDTERMLQILKMEDNDPLLLDIKKYQDQKQYSTACKVYCQRQLRCESNICDSSFNFSPVKYYFASKTKSK